MKTYLVVEDYKVAILEVEAIQFVAGRLRIHDILVDNKGSALGIGRDPLADLANGAEFA